MEYQNVGKNKSGKCLLPNQKKNTTYLFKGDDPPKRLHTELQALISYGIYDSKEIMGKGKAMKKAMIREEMT